MSERNGFKVEKRFMPEYGKHWMFVTTKGEGAPVSFRDWFDMVQCLLECEVEKYVSRFGGDPESPDEWERWTREPLLFLIAACQYGATYEQLQRRFNLPR